MANQDKDLNMADAILADMQRITHFAAEPRASDDSAKAAIGRAAKALGLSYRRARSFWYATPTAAVRAAEADKLRQEEVRLLARERIRLTTRMAWIQARLDAQEAGGHADETDGHHKKHQKAGTQALGSNSDGELDSSTDHPATASSNLLAGTEGPIADPRQMRWGW